LTPGERQPSHWSKEGDDAELEEPLGIPGLEVHPSLEEALHLHQLDGFKFLSRHLVEEDAGGCMLAFAPGTGKTFLVISFLQSFLTQVPHAKPVVVAPKGMLRTWAQEFKKWEVEEIPIFDLYEANGVESQSDLLQKWQQRERSVLLVGYPQFVNMTGDVGKLLTEGPGLLILDGGHLARTKNTKILTSMM
jgi:DNA repair and recombination RAD54-like protein